MATDAIQDVKIDDGEKIMQALASSMEAGLAAALKEWTAGPASASCRRIEKTSLQAVLANAGTRMNAFEILYHTGLNGRALMLISATDLIKLAALGGGEVEEHEPALSRKALEACSRYLSRALEGANEQFRQRHQHSIHCEKPGLLNSDAGTESLQPLMESYQNIAAMAFQLRAGSRLDCNIHVLVQETLKESLKSLLPECMADDHRESPRPGGDSPGSHQERTSPKSGSSPSGTKMSQNWNIDLLLDVELPIVVSFGDAEMPLRDVLKLGVGSVIELDKAVNDPVTVIVNKKPIARGEVVMVDGNYGVRILEVESTADRIRSLG